MILLNAVLLTVSPESHLSGKRRSISMAKGSSFLTLAPLLAGCCMELWESGSLCVCQDDRRHNQPKSPDWNLENRCALGQRHCVSLSFICSFLSPSLLWVIPFGHVSASGSGSARALQEVKQPHGGVCLSAICQQPPASV